MQALFKNKEEGSGGIYYLGKGMKKIKDFKVKKEKKGNCTVITLPPMKLGQTMFANGITGKGEIFESEKDPIEEAIKKQCQYKNDALVKLLNRNKLTVESFKKEGYVMTLSPDGFTYTLCRPVDSEKIQQVTVTTT